MIANTIRSGYQSQTGKAFPIKEKEAAQAQEKKSSGGFGGLF